MAMERAPLALVLAAGYSRRFGRDKRWISLASGRAMVDEVLVRISEAGLPAQVVLRTDDEEGLARDWPVPVLRVPAERSERGLGASLAAAASQLADGQSCLVCLADMPFIKSDTYARVAAALTPGSIVVPVCDGRRGHPVAFGARFHPELRVLDGDHGARSVLEANPECVMELPVVDAGIRRDVDTVLDLLGGLGSFREQ